MRIGLAVRAPGRGTLLNPNVMLALALDIVSHAYMADQTVFTVISAEIQHHKQAQCACSWPGCSQQVP